MIRFLLALVVASTSCVTAQESSSSSVEQFTPQSCEPPCTQEQCAETIACIDYGTCGVSADGSCAATEDRFCWESTGCEQYGACNRCAPEVCANIYPGSEPGHCCSSLQCN
jgi:hypothetical protein